MGRDESDDIAQSKQHIGGIFDRAATSYDHVGPQFFSYFGKRLVEFAEISAGCSVLDVATGRGALLFPAADVVGPRGQVIGIDLAKTMVEETSKELARLNMPSNIHVRQMDAEHLQFPDESFDYVLCGFAIFFFPQLSHAMAEFHRVLKPGGRICISTWDKSDDDQWSWLDKIAKEHLPANPEPDPSQEENPTPQPVFNTIEGLTSIVEKARFESIQVRLETKDFVYKNNEEFWLTLWSHGKRAYLETIEKSKGQEGLQQFRSDVFRNFDHMKKDDGFHQAFSALIGLATKPQSSA